MVCLHCPTCKCSGIFSSCEGGNEDIFTRALKEKASKIRREAISYFDNNNPHYCFFNMDFQRDSNECDDNPVIRTGPPNEDILEN